MTDTIANRVAKGAAWLDIEKPGWEARIDLGRLDMADACLCVLGQVYAAFAYEADDGEHSGFDYAVDDLGVADFEYGFNVSWSAPLVGRQTREAQFVELGTEWKRLITERRSAS